MLALRKPFVRRDFAVFLKYPSEESTYLIADHDLLKANNNPLRGGNTSKALAWNRKTFRKGIQ